MQFQQNMTATIQDLKTQIGQLANTMSQLQSAGSSNLPSQTILNPRGNANAQLPKSVEADSKPNADPQSRPERVVPLPFPSRTISTRKPELDEELLKMFQKVEINIPLLDAIKQVLKYAKLLKELWVHKSRKIKWSRKIGGVVSALTRNEEFTTGPLALPKKCRDPGIFSVLCTIGKCTFADAMLDLGASINVMPASIYRSLNFGDLEPTGMTIQLVNRSIVQPLGVLEDVLVQVNELIFLADFYVLDMEDEMSGKESTLILERPFLMTAKIKIDVHSGMVSMEFGDTLVQFNIFEAMKHPIEDHSLFGIDLLDEIVEEYFQLNSSNEDIEKFTGSADEINCLGVAEEEADHKEVQDLPNFEDDHSDIADLGFEVELSSTDPLYTFDPEIELTLRRLRKIRNTTVNISSSVNSVNNSDQSYTDNFVASTNIFTKPGQMENHDRMLKELATPDVVYQPWCIQYPQLEPAQTYELKSGLIHLLPKFHGLAGEDPHKHLKEFHVVCSTMRPQGISEDYIKMKAFPFSLDGAAKDWLYLQPVLFNTWGDMKRTFLEKFFSASRTASIRKEICGIRQHTGETLHEYWERLNKLCATCPHHQISEQLLI
ncbi:hypothetical protein CR513_08305, partial [Mucuna pruriens]